MTLQAKANSIIAAAEVALFDAVIEDVQAATDSIRTDLKARITDIARKLNALCADKIAQHTDSPAAVSAINAAKNDYMQHVRFIADRLETTPSQRISLPEGLEPPAADDEEIEFELIDPAVVAELDRVAAESAAAAAGILAAQTASAAPAAPLAPAAPSDILIQHDTAPQRPSAPAARQIDNSAAAATPGGQHRAPAATTPGSTTPSGHTSAPGGAGTAAAAAATTATAARLDAAVATTYRYTGVPATGRPGTSQTPAAATAGNMPATPSQAEVNMQIVNMLNSLQQRVEQIDTQQQQQAQPQQQQQTAADTPNSSHNRSRPPHSSRATSSSRQQQSGRQLNLQTRTGLSPDSNGPVRHVPIASRYSPFGIPSMGPLHQHPLPPPPPSGYGSQRYY